MLSLIMNESVTEIGTNAFKTNQIINITIPDTVTHIGAYAFSIQKDSDGNRTLTSILIKRTEEDFLANVTIDGSWYDNTLKPTITYDPS